MHGNKSNTILRQSGCKLLRLKPNWCSSVSSPLKSFWGFWQVLQYRTYVPMIMSAWRVSLTGKLITYMIVAHFLRSDWLEHVLFQSQFLLFVLPTCFIQFACNCNDFFSSFRSQFRIRDYAVCNVYRSFRSQTCYYDYFHEPIPLWRRWWRRLFL